MKNCIFCQVASGKAKSWKVDETDHAYAFLDIHPVNEYHTLVITKRHYESVLDVPHEELVQLITLLKNVVDLYQSRLGLKHFQIINSSGADAQQDVFHIHFHIVPRHLDDGQDVKWTTHPEMRQHFDQMIARLRQ